MIQISLTPEQFAKARAAILTSSKVLQHTEATETDGSFATSQIALDYSYAAGVLTLDVTAKHGMAARMASEEQIKEHVMDMLGKV